MRYGRTGMGSTDRMRAAKALSQPVGLQIGPRFLVSQLAFVDWAANTSAAEKAAHSIEQSRYSLTAMGAEHPGPVVAEVAGCPRELHILRRYKITEIHFNHISVGPYRCDLRPPQQWPKRHGTFLQQALPIQFAYIETIGCQFFDGQALSITTIDVAHSNNQSRVSSDISPLSMRFQIASRVASGRS